MSEPQAFTMDEWLGALKEAGCSPAERPPTEHCIKPRDLRNLFFRNGAWWIDIQIHGQRYRGIAGVTEREAQQYRDRLKQQARNRKAEIKIKRINLDSANGAPLASRALADHPPSRWMTVKEAAKYLSIRPATMYRWVADGQVPGIHIGQASPRGRGRHRYTVRIDGLALDQHLAAQGMGGAIS